MRPLNIQRLYRSMQDRGLSPRVVRYTHAVLSSAFKQAVKWDMLHRSPAAVVDLPRQERKEMKAMTAEEANSFLSAVRETRVSALFMFALTTGMRPQEFLALRWSDVDMVKGTEAFVGLYFGVTRKVRAGTLASLKRRARGELCRYLHRWLKLSLNTNADRVKKGCALGPSGKITV